MAAIETNPTNLSIPNPQDDTREFADCAATGYQTAELESSSSSSGLLTPSVTPEASEDKVRPVESNCVHDPFQTTGLELEDIDWEDTVSNKSNTFETTPSRSDMPLLPALGLSHQPTSTRNPSPTEQEWERQKRDLGEYSKALDQLMSMVGLEEVKREFLAVKATITAARQRKGILRRQDFNLVLTGNYGTGKRTLAAIYKDLLTECGVWKWKPTYETRSGFDFQGDKSAESLRSYLDSFGDQRPVQSSRIQLVVVLAGSNEGVTNLLGSLPSGRWVFPRRLQLKDYNDEHLRLILLQLIRHNLFAVEGGDDGPYPRIVAKRVGRGRKSSGFANVYDLVLAFGKIVDRQALRLKKGLADGPKSRAQTANKTDDNQIANSACSLLTRQDLIGPEPKDVRHYSTAWKEFEQMVGLDSVKGAIGELLTRAKVNYRREIVDKEPLQTSLNRVFIGPPGTGKTTVAKLYGQILADIGLLSTKEVVYKTPDDFLGQYMGESEAKTSQILDSTVGKVLIVDDAHMIYQGGKGNCASETDNYRLGCIDTIVTKIHNRPGEDRCVILLGYPDLMEEMFRNVNPGLRRRFPLEEAFRFQNYDDEHLNQILRLKMAKEEISATEHAMDVAAEVLRRSRDRPNFGNGGDVDNLLNQAKTRFRGRQETDKTIQTEKPKATQPDIYNGDISDSDSEENNTIVLEPQDFDPEWDRGVHATKKCQALFDGLIGFEPIINTFQGYHRMAANLRRRGRDPRDIVPFTFLFKGPPGTGKTHTARIVGQIFYDMGFLSTAEVIECSASHLIGQYMGQTAPKVIDMFERALGKVLFIDEAYRLAGGAGSLGGTQTYESEAVGELVDCMTKKRYLKKMVIVLAGYDKDMDSLIQVNAGLRGRFATEIVFPPMDATRMREYLYKLLNKEDIEVWDEAKPELGGEEAMLKLLGDLSRTPGWSNGRDIKTLAGVITGEVYKTAALEDLEDGDENVFRISTAQLNGFLEDMLRQRTQVGEAGRETDKIGSYE